MTEEIERNAALLADLAHLRTDLELTQAELAQTERALAAERVARMRAEGDAAALREALITWIAADGTMAFTDADEKLASLARTLRDTSDHPGAQLLAELAAARKILATLRQHHDAGGEVWGSIDRDFAAYDAARGGETT